MKRFAWMTLWVAVVAAAAVWAQVAVSDTTTDGLGSSTPTAANLPELRTRALAQLASGDFHNGAAALAQALQAEPHDELAARANVWVSDFLRRRDEDEQQRQREQDAAVGKAQALFALAQSADPTGPAFRQAREQMTAARKAYAELAAGPALTGGTPGQDDYPDRVEQGRQKILEHLDHVMEAFAEDPGPYVQDIRQAVRRAVAAVEQFGQGVAARSWQSPREARESFSAVRADLDQAQQALDAVALLVTDSPLRASLEQIRLARDISRDKPAFTQQAWVRQVQGEALKRADALADEAQWYKALSFYSALADLDQHNKHYRNEVRRVSRHARLISLYGPPEARAALSGAGEPEDGDEDGAEPAPAGGQARWRDYVDRVDTKMVKQAISHMEEAYVDTVDYRKVVLGALDAVRLLAQTPALTKTFPGLVDDARRDQFLRDLQTQVDITMNRDTVRHFHVGMTLDRVLAANDQTVRIPPEVIDVEFTDGMLEQLDDFSSMIWPSEWAEFQKQTKGTFYGVGIQIQMDSGAIKVVSPLEDTPAYKAGIQAGDLIVAIDGTSTQNMDVNDAVKRITGQRGTRVVLTIKRIGREEPFDVPVTRDEIHIQTVKGWKRANGDGWEWMIDPDDRIGYIRLTSFTEDTPADLRAALSQLRRQGVRGLILDLRFNPGGYLRSATRVADEFLNQGVIVSTKGRQQPSSEDGATIGGNYLDGELIVLVNDGSASAAEIVSGALKDWQRATIVGTRSYGKGSVQNLILIRPEMAYLKLTTAYYYLPKGRCLHRTEDAETWGVEPDVHVPVTPEQMRRWLELRRQTEIIQQRADAELNRQMGEQLRADIQLDAALLVLRLRLLNS